MKIVKEAVLCFLIIVLSPAIIKAISSNKLLYDNKTFNLPGNLMESVYLENNGKEYFKSGSEITVSDINWCDYISIYEIEEDTLYLRGITKGCSDIPVFSLKELFGEKCLNGRVKAVWFTGKLRIPEGIIYKTIYDKSIQGRHNYYEKNIVLNIEAGKITEKTIIDNLKNEIKTVDELAFISVKEPEEGNIFGQYFGENMDKLIEDLGEPTKMARLNGNETKIFYGRSYAFIFKEEKLKEIYYFKEDTEKDMQKIIDSTLVPIIDPDESIFGIPFGAKIVEFIARFGKPKNYVKFSKTEIELLYGRNYAFLFRDGKLSGVRSASSMYSDDVSITSEYVESPGGDGFDYLSWKLSNGITEGVNLADTENILDKNKGEFDKYNWKYTFSTGRSYVTLLFGGSPENGLKNKQIYGISISLK